MSRIVKYDILRVVACFSIILLHVSASYWSVVDVRGGEFLVMTVYNSLTRFAVPVFFMLSGLFLVAPERENVAIGKRVLRLVMLFYVWSAFYAFQGIAVDTLKGAFSMEVFRAAVERFDLHGLGGDRVRQRGRQGGAGPGRVRHRRVGDRLRGQHGQGDGEFGPVPGQLQPGHPVRQHPGGADH